MSADGPLFEKFTVTRNDACDGPGGKHHGCEYFVLDLTHDKHALAALRAYAYSCLDERPLIAAALIRKVRDFSKRQGVSL